LNNLLALFSNNLLPIFLAAGTGYLAARYLGVTPRSLSQVTFYIFSPSLVFNLLNKSQLTGEDIGRMASFAAVTILTLGALTWIIGSLLRLERRLLVAVMLTVMFSNAGNYGLSLTWFSFGDSALAHASLYFVTSAIMIYTVGVTIASLGSMNLKTALLGLSRVPALYAVVIALLFNHFEWRLALPLDRTVTLLGDAAIPALMVLMGVQLQHAVWNGETLALSLASGMRLVAGPAVALGISLLFGLTGPAFKAGILESATPTAVLMTVLATEYNVEPSFVTAVVLTTTLLSPFTITPLLAFLGA
jgi:malate permease and related proteins